jgi:hypothetical protein
MFKARTSWNSLWFQMGVNGEGRGFKSAVSEPVLGHHNGDSGDQIDWIANEGG